MKIKTGDTVTIISGKDKGSTGKVLKAFPREDKIIVEGVNIKKRHQRSGRQGQKGSIIEQAARIHVSNARNNSVVKKNDKKTEPKKVAVKKPSSKKE